MAAIFSSQPGSLYAQPGRLQPGSLGLDEGQPSITSAMTLGMSATNRADLVASVTQGMTMGMSASLAGTFDEAISQGMTMGMSAALVTVKAVEISAGMVFGMSAVLSGLSPEPPEPPTPPEACEPTSEPAYTPTLVSYVEPSERTGS